MPVLDQIEETLDWIAEREGVRPDLSRIDPEDPAVYDLINAGRAKGVFLLQSPAQLQIARRLRARTLQDLAYQVALIRPGVGVQGGAVSQFIARHRDGAAWTYDHPLEARALARTSGVIVWQEQVVQLIIDVAGMRAAEADALRRAFARPQSEHWVGLQRQRFLAAAGRRGVPEDVARTIFAKINGHYMFPESHSHAFAITAYQAVWLKRYYPLEFFVALVNQQPMGFYPLETLKEDARRGGAPFRNPCLNRSRAGAIPEDGGVRLGLQRVKAVGRASAARIVGEPVDEPGSRHSLSRRAALAIDLDHDFTAARYFAPRAGRRFMHGSTEHDDRVRAGPLVPQRSMSLQAHRDRLPRDARPSRRLLRVLARRSGAGRREPRGRPVVGRAAWRQAASWQGTPRSWSPARLPLHGAAEPPGHSRRGRDLLEGDPSMHEPLAGPGSRG